MTNKFELHLKDDYSEKISSKAKEEVYHPIYNHSIRGC